MEAGRGPLMHANSSSTGYGPRVVIDGLVLANMAQAREGLDSSRQCLFQHAVFCLAAVLPTRVVGI